MKEPPQFRVPEGNSTPVCVCTDAALDKRRLLDGGAAATAGLGRAVDPVFTPVDGDVVFCLASGAGGAGSVRALPDRRGGRDGDGGGDPGRGAPLGRADQPSGRLRQRSWAMPGSCKTEAVVLRSIRYGEADRIVHLYSRDAGADRRDREGVAPAEVAVRRAARAVLPARPRALRGPGRPAHGDRRLDGRRSRGRCASNGPALGAAGTGLRRGAAAARLGGAERGGLQPALQLPRAAGRRSGGGERAGRGARLPAQAGAGGRILTGAGELCQLRGGRAPRGLLGRGRAEWSAPAARGAAFRSHEEAHRFMVDALARPLSEAPGRGPGVAAQADRAITETLEHHAHVRLRAAA